ncbi:MAG: ATP-dependent helicase [Desulfobacteraceae bacterium]|nr:ATP-dependent helicase [Desulfobacteraceae bacterium]
MDSLSTEQRAAVETTSTKSLTLAGAGSGKTRVLIKRIQHLMENEKVSPFEILAFTFTRKAAGEIKKRLEESVGPQAHRVTMGTMHGVALNMLQRFGEMVGLRPGKITVYSGWEEQFLLKDVAMELGYHSGKAWKGVRKKDIDKEFNWLYTTPHASIADSGLYEHEIMRAFFDRCRENNALTYGSILKTFEKLLPKIAHMLQFKHILVDETQDNDPLQWFIVNKMCELCGASLFAVGDIDQSIYAFRGADPEYLVRHENDFDIYRLQANYRSSASIVEGANRLIEHNDNRLPKTMVPNRKDSNPTHCVENKDSAAIVEMLEESYSGGYPPENIAVLGRNHFLLAKLSRLLEEAGFPHEYVGKDTALTNSEEFRRFHAFLKLIVNPFDNFSFLLIRDIAGISQEEYGEVRVKAAQKGGSHFQTWLSGEPSVNPFQNYTHKDFNALVEHITFWCQSFSEVNDIKSFALQWAEESPNIQDTACDEGPVQNYLGWLATYDLQDEIKEDVKGVQLMTIHASKGLEFPTVIIAGLNEGIFPSKHAQKNMDEMEGERRLAYVASTRAENQLILTSRPVERDPKSGKIKGPASRFIRETIQKKEKAA